MMHYLELHNDSGTPRHLRVRQQLNESHHVWDASILLSNRNRRTLTTLVS